MSAPHPHKPGDRRVKRYALTAAIWFVIIFAGEVLRRIFAWDTDYAIGYAVATLFYERHFNRVRLTATHSVKGADRVGSGPAA